MKIILFEKVFEIKVFQTDYSLMKVLKPKLTFFVVSLPLWVCGFKFSISQ